MKILKEKTNLLIVDDVKFITMYYICEPYFDEGWHYYRSKGRRKLKELLHFQVRMYRTWKHNRKTRWK